MKSEFEFIQHIKEKYGLTKIGDDCAVLPKDDKTDMVITADMLVQDIDFRLHWVSSEDIGHKSLAVSLSDVAAMGGTPKWAMVSIAVPGSLWDNAFVDRFYEGWHKLAGKYSVELIGGDISRSPDRVVIDSMVGGEVPRGKAILRSGAKPGDLIYVSGSLGGAARGLELLSPDLYELKSVPREMSELQARQATPMPQVELGIKLLSAGAVTSMIDVSDGLSSDIHQICEASNVGALLNLALIPTDENLKRLWGGSSDEEIEKLVLNGGEDFELLFSVPKEKKSLVEHLPITHIGEITSNTGIIELIRDGKTEILEPKGYRHF